jgi:hypothetical protein
VSPASRAKETTNNAARCVFRHADLVEQRNVHARFHLGLYEDSRFEESQLSPEGFGDLEQVVDH